MATETKKNPDYAASAINLTCPEEIKFKLLDRVALQKTIAELEAILQAYPEYQQLQEMNAQLVNLDKGLKMDIDKYGSYQDIDHGLYAVKQKRMSLSYDAMRFRTIYPQHSEAVIIETVNVPVLKGLIKGGLVTEDKLEPCVTRTATEAYIIKS